MIALCSTSIDWAATGTWVTGLATAVIGFCALRTWKSQLKLQDRYQKVDALLEAFVLCIRAGHNWQWNEIDNIKIGKSSELPETKDFTEWREAFMQYRLVWCKAMHVTDDDAWFSPDKLQSEVIAIGVRTIQKSKNDSDALLKFEAEFTDVFNKGLLDISKLRNS